ncbi:MAG TPA: uroporphyrinogen-III synthase, partial [Candidatus Eisenbacteria bacterium]|nr:uroporphyrinogen-III synthase [Candidatus Eisenbacteria bacterium]
WRAAHADAVVVASPSAARALVHAVGAPALAAPGVIAIGATTAAALAALGVAADVPERADFEGVARRLAAADGHAAPRPRA